MSDHGLADDIRKLREAFGPALEQRRIEQDALWKTEGTAATASLDATGATLGSIGGNCPVQAEGTIDDRFFYFRARGDAWSFSVGDTPEEAVTGVRFFLEEEYGSWPDAGWMPRHEAVGFIVKGINAYRSNRP